jgi:hypothetical protein
MNVLRPSRARFVIALLLPVLAFLAMAAPAAAVSDYHTFAPCEVYDSRDINGGAKLSPGIHTISIADEPCTVSSGVTVTVPADAEAVVLNVTIASPTARGTYAIAPADAGADPLADGPGFLFDKNRAFTSIVPLGTGGDVEVRVTLEPPGGDFHLVVFVQGYFRNAPTNVVDDVATVDEDAAATPVDVLANDSDADDTLTIVSATDPAHGTVVLTGGSPGAHTGLTYQPDADYCGADTFDYTTSTGAVGTVDVTVTCVDDSPTAVDDAATVQEDAAAAPVDVLANDEDVEGDPFFIASATDPAHGTVVLTGGSPGAHTGLTYQPDANYCGPDSFDYTLTPGGDTATVTITVECVEGAPVAVDDAATVAEDVAATPIDVLVNDSDDEGDPFTIDSATDPAHGTVVITGGGTGLTYQPDADYCNNPPGTLPDTFTYTLTPGGSTATVSVLVTCINDGPLVDLDANDDKGTAGNDFAVTFTEGEAAKLIEDELDATVTDDGATLASLTVTITNLLDAGSETLSTDVTGTSITASYVAATGVLTLTGPDTVANFQTVLRKVRYLNSDNAPDTTPRVIHFVANDGALNSNTAVSTVTVVAVDTEPTAVNDVGTVDEDSGAAAVDVLANDTDPDSGPISISSVTQPANGTVVITGGGTGLTYQPNANYCNSVSGVPDTFTYSLAPGSSTATVSMTVTCIDDNPVAVSDVATVVEDSGANSIGVLANDTDADGGPISITSVNQPANGVVAITGGGTGLTYAPNANYCNTPPGTTLDTFTYTLTPGGSSTTVTVTVTCVDDNPTAVADAATVIEDSGANAIGVLGNDTDPDSGPISVTAVTQPANGAVAITDGGTGLSYTPSPNYCNAPPGTTLETFTYTLSPGGSSTTVTVSVTCVDDPPTAVADAVTVVEDSGANPLSVLANDTDVDGGAISITSVTQPANGTVVITGGGTGLTYAPNLNYCNNPPGTSLNTFTYTLTPGGSSTTVTVTVTCVNDPPVAGTDSFETFGNTELRVDLETNGTTPHILVDLTGAPGVMNNDSDPVEGTAVSFSGVVGCADLTAPFECATANGGQVIIEADGSFRYLPPQANPAVLATDSSDSFQYTIVDAEGAPATGTVNLIRREVIWYVDPTAGAGGDGRSHNPFQNFASLNGVAGAGDLDNADDYILVHDGTFTGSVELEAGQRLIGQGVGLTLPLGSLGPKEILAATTHPQINNASGDVIRVTSAVPARIAGLSLSGSVNAIDMPATGAYTGSGTLTIENNIFRGAGAEGIDINAGATGTLALNVQNNSWSAAGTHVGNAVDVAATNGALQLNISNNSNVLSTGASGIVAGASAPGVLTITGLTGNTVHQSTAGTGISINAALFDATPGGAVNRVYGGNSRIGTSGDGVGGAGLALTNVTGDLAFGDEITVGDLDVYSAGAALTATSTVVGGIPQFRLTVTPPANGGSSTLVATGGAAVDIDSVTADLRLSALSSTNGLRGVSLVRLLPGSPAATFPARFHAPSGSSITTSNAAATAFRVDQSNAAVAYQGTINATAGRGVDLTSNTGSTIDFSGVLTLATGVNPAFTATGGGTVTSTDAASTLTTTTATALNVADTNIGGSGVTFRSITSTTAGANTAIILANTGSGPFLVAGNGSSGTGGTISNKSVDAVTMNNTDGSVTLRNMIIQDIGDLGGVLNTISGDDGIHAQQVDGGLVLENVIIRRISDQAIHGALSGGGATVWNGLTITNSTIEDTNRFNVANVGDANNEGMIRILGIRGNVSITGSTLQRGGELVDFFVTDGTLNMAASTNNFHTAYKEFTSGTTASVGGHCIDVTVQGAANANVRVGDRSDSGLANNFLNCRLGSVRVANDSGATGSIDVVIGRNAFTVNDHSSGFGGDFDFPQGGVLVMSRGTDAATFDVVIDGNYFDEITNASGGVGQVSYDMQNGNWQVLMEDNTFDTPGNAPWFLRADSTASARVLFRNNVGIKGFFTCPDASCAGGYNGPGLRSLADLQNGALLDLTIVGDQFAEHDAGFDPGQTFEARALNTGGGGTLCLDLQNNRAPDGYSLEEFAGDLNLVGSGSCLAGSPSASCQALLGARGNLGGSDVATTSPPFVNVSGTIDVVAAACQQPAGSIF